MTAARAFSVLAVAGALALALVLVPLRDRCWDPRAAASTRVAVTRDPAGCTLHLRSGSVSIDARECAQLRCEPGLVSALSNGWGAVLCGATLGVAIGAAMWVRRRRRMSSATAAP